jgi:ubiquinone/menaquinone biosynthesis C-methylase UbiE
MERYVIRGGSAGYRRLQMLARVQNPNTLEVLRQAGLCPGMHCLDVGCGSGDVTFELAWLAGPDGSATGLDMDPVKLGLATDEAAARGLANVTFREASVRDWHEPAAYDLVFSRFLLQHLADPAAALARMWAAVRPGGVLIAQDADFTGLFCDPPNAGFTFYAEKYQQALALNGGDPGMARKLYRSFLAAGLPDPQLQMNQTAGTDPDGDTKLLALSTLEATAESIVGAGVATAEDAAAAQADLAAFIADPHTLVADPRIFSVWAHRPDA